ncbi:hypothetical protein [Algisphaera agarilytica]|uniref:Uncharacterized protein n=1 Tax=Algisphaera agarilytica TaxID=1385975 RepID=A0A7X0LK23_9BACT|nr:hypothetical protein [Algisphaera agarilytica]MBB6429990.1 hypothetical protein [Algisphaera agarilytica]
MSYMTPMTKHFATLTGGVLLWGGVLMGSPAAAQTASGGGVDASVADRDPLATSLRRVEPGNAQFSFQNRLTRTNFRVGWSPFAPATDPGTGLTHTHQYQYRSPGLRALIDRPEYVPVRGGGEVMIIPANTVFQLTLERPADSGDEEPTAHANYQDYRLGHHANPGTHGSASGMAFPDLRLDRVPVSELSPIPHPSQMRFPLAAFPNGIPEDTREADQADAEQDEDSGAESQADTQSTDSTTSGQADSEQGAETQPESASAESETSAEAQSDSAAAE